MSKNRSVSQNSMLLPLLASVVLAVVGLVFFAGHYKVLTVLAGLVCLYLLLRRDLSALRSIPALLLLGYVVFSGLSIFWAISGKFFLAEYSEIFVATTLFLAVMLCRNFNRKKVHSIMTVMVVISTSYSVLSVEAATTGVSISILSALIPAFGSISTGFEVGTRLTGILGNANIMSTIVALGILFSLCLLCGQEDENKRPVYAAVTAINAFVFLLLFSMGGTACFAAAVLVYLAFAGKNRANTLVRMLECAIPALLWVFVAFPFFNQEGVAVLIPLVALVGSAVTAFLLEKLVAPKLVGKLEQRGKLVIGVLAGVLALAVVYIALGVTLSGAYTFDGEQLRRSAYPSAGEHTLSIQASGNVDVTIISQDMSQVMMHTNTVLYQGSAQDATFTVPEDSEVCYFTFSADPGTVLDEAKLSSGDSLKLKYTLLPGFIANRLQGLAANQNAIQRTVFFEDGMKMFYQSPVVGNGVGSFGTGISSVQEFYYETKYIHNHYIQVLLESGLLGFLPFVGALLGMAVLLWKRRKDEEWEYQMEYPALWGALVMLCAHMTFEVSMSIIIPLCFAFVIFALIIRCCAKQPEAAAKSVVRNKKNNKAFLAKVGCTLFPAFFVISVCCNMAADSICDQPVRSYSHFLSNLELSSKIDLYEKNDSKLSYVLSVQRQDLVDFIPDANRHAADLLAQQSNTIPNALLGYYLGTCQYDQALEAAKAAAKYSASDAKVWNKVIDQYRIHFLENPDSPLLTGDTAALTAGVMEYHELLQTRNASSMEEITLSQENAAFFVRMQKLAQSNMTQADVEEILTITE